MAIIFIGLGSNEGHRISILRSALLDLKKNLGILLSCSSIYETPPLGFESDQPFLNAVVKFETTHLPEEVLNILHYIESKAGRERTEKGRYHNRTLDLDLLYYDDLVLDTEKITVPHPRIPGRKFVLVPLAEIDPQWMDSKHGKTVGQLLLSTSDQSVTEKLQTSLHLTF